MIKTKPLRHLFLAISALCITASAFGNSSVNDTIPAFPGAEGAAKFTPGGRGGDVYYVTNTDTSGEGSLVHGIETADGPRTIVFNTSGIIHFEEGLRLSNKKRLTIAGQTAPGDGITLRLDGDALRLSNCEDIIITHLRIVNGSDESRHDLIRTSGSKNIMLSHLTIRWGTRGNFVSRPDGPLTAQYLINAEPTDRQLAGWFGHMRHEGGVFNQTVRKNLGIHQGGRLNMFQAGRFEFINNITYNGESRRPDLGPYYIMARPWHGTRDSELGPQIFDANVINNIMIDGENPPEATFGFGRSSRVYIEGNVRDRNPDAPFSPEPADDDVYEGEVPRGGHRGDQFALFDLPLDLQLSEKQRTRPVSVRQTYINVLSRAGASAARDMHDHRYVRDVLNKSGRHASSLEDVPGEVFPEHDKGEAQHSSAGDGIPDAWKEKHGLDTNTAYHQQYTEEGYTYLEKYLHWLMRHSIPPAGSETETIVVPLTYGQSDHGTVDVMLKEETRQFVKMRFDLSKIEPGMLNDAHLELSPLDNGSTQYLVYGLEYSHNSGQIARDDLILLGNLYTEKDNRNMTVSKLTNPNLAVFLNLAMYFQNDLNDERATLVFEPLDDNVADFYTDKNPGKENPDYRFVPRLILDAVPNNDQEK